MLDSKVGVLFHNQHVLSLCLSLLSSWGLWVGGKETAARYTPAQKYILPTLHTFSI